MLFLLLPIEHQFYAHLMKKTASNFHETKKSEMNSSYVYLFGILVIGFVVYYVALREKLFDIPDTFLPSDIAAPPAPSTIEVRQAPLYPPRNVGPSGPNAPSQAPPTEVHHAEMGGVKDEQRGGDATLPLDPRQRGGYTGDATLPLDPYREHQESSDIPENLRHPERSFRAPPVNDQTSLAVSSGIASHTNHVSSDHSQQFQTETISGGGEFMPGIFANDVFHDASFSAF